MEKKYILAFDEGTTGCRSILMNHDGNEVASVYQEFTQYFPSPEKVEHDALEIWNAQLHTAKETIAKAGASADEIAAIGITNQRETFVVWEKNTGNPVAHAIVWQDKRSTAICRQLEKDGALPYIKENTGLIIDSYFSGTKLKWLLDQTEGLRERAKQGELCFGTIDSWLIWKLTGGKAHVVDYSNASRTLLFNIRKLDWDEELLRMMDIPKEILPQPRPSCEVYGTTDPDLFDGAEIPIAASLGDQMAALFGQGCFQKGMVKATYGTGGTLMMNAGKEPILSQNGLLTSVGWGLNGTVEYSLEGLIYVTGSAVQWLRDELRLIHDAADTAFFAEKVPDTNGVYFVPAFTGLSAPYWDEEARGAIVGLTRGTRPEHIIRATLESMAYQIRDLVYCMEQDTGTAMTELKVDGGACKNDFVMQFQADLLQIPVIRSRNVEYTAKGAANMAGLAVGFWENQEELNKIVAIDKTFTPQMDEETRAKLYAGWQRAVAHILTK